jgi:hypothetical protein
VADSPGTIKIPKGEYWREQIKEQCIIFHYTHFLNYPEFPFIIASKDTLDSNADRTVAITTAKGEPHW